ncbi:amidohydrolase family protein [Paludisphaera sp.]|uniref:amidohydrolase family protein n=1 Tax=Paludisphaera sp. TaxID=2017432 RepID=UPI00301DE936
MGMIRWRGLTILALALTVAWPRATAADEAPADVVLAGGTVVDGTGSPGARADVAIKGDRIVAVGDLSGMARARTVDATGLVVAPGFIDLHTHSDSGIVGGQSRLNLNYIAQGVTTIVTGNCGSGPIDVEAYLGRVDRAGAGSNVVHLLPHGALRREVMGVEDREPTAEEMARLKALATKAMDAGAWGMSTGLIYVPSRYARTEELVELATLVHGYGGIYASHIRDEGSGLLRAVDEALTIGERSGAPVHVSHLKAGGRSNWGKTADALERIAAARASGRVATADQYPYVASSTSLGAMVVPHWAVSLSKEEFAKLADDPEKGAELRREIQRSLDGRDGGAAIRLARYAPKPSRVGKDLATIAKEEGTTPLEIVLDIQRNGGTQAINFSMSEDEVREVMKSDLVATASDGGARGAPDDTRPHPRSFGTFARKIRYALDDRVITLEHAIRSGSGLPAAILGLVDRGVIRPGAYADVVAFDPETFRDKATFDDPQQYAEGMKHVFVNGVAVISDGVLPPFPAKDDKLPGRALRLKKDGPADLVLIPGRIWTGDRANPWAEALAARGGEIVAVGSRDETMRWKGPSTRVVEAPGALATPGLVDAHGHIEMLGASFLQLDLRGVASLDEVAARVKERAAALPPDAWILGASWDQSLWPGEAYPDAAVLDAAAPGRPVWLARVDGHAGWASTEAMKRAKVDAATQPPSDGQIHRGPDGNPTGIFIDGAMGLIDRVVPPPSREEVRARILAAQDHILARGLTGVHDAGVPRRVAEVFDELDREGLLKLRCYAMTSPPGGKEAEALATPPADRPAGSRFEMRGAKLFIDGAMGSSGALLFEPYADDPTNKGLLLIDPATLEAATVAGLKNGWQVAVHAIGDRGNALVLDAFAAARKAVPEATDPRLRIEHAQVVRREDVARFAELGVIASMQPSHASDDMRWADARLGPGRVDGAYAWRWFLDGGVRVAFGSDFPVEVVDPQWGLYAAVTRQDREGRPVDGWHPDQRMSLEETLRAFTAEPAFAAFAEDRQGVLKPGLRADVTVFDRDLFSVPPAEILESKVRCTVVDGEVVFDSARP